MNSVFQRWRELRGGNGRFESAVSKYRHLLEYGTPPSSDVPTMLDKMIVPNDDLIDDATRKKLIKRSFDSRRERMKTLQRIRQLTLGDFNTVGGIAPIGSIGGGGSDGYRPTPLGRS